MTPLDPRLIAEIEETLEPVMEERHKLIHDAYALSAAALQLGSWWELAMATADKPSLETFATRAAYIVACNMLETARMEVAVTYACHVCSKQLSAVIHGTLVDDGEAVLLRADKPEGDTDV